MKKETPPSALSSQLQRKRAKMTFFPPLPLSLRAMQTADKKVEEEGSVIRGFCSRSQSPPKRCAKGGRNPDENCTWSRFQLAKMIQVFRPGPDPPRLSCVLCLENVFLLLLRLNGGDRRDGRDGGGKKITSPRFSSSHSRRPLVLHPPYFLPPGFGTLLLLLLLLLFGHTIAGTYVRRGEKGSQKTIWIVRSTSIRGEGTCVGGEVNPIPHFDCSVFHIFH